MHKHVCVCACVYARTTLIEMCVCARTTLVEVYGGVCVHKNNTGGAVCVCVQE